MDDIVIGLTATCSFAIALFGAALCLMQSRHGRVNRTFAAFLAMVAVNNLPEALAPLFDTLPPIYLSVATVLTWPSSFLLAPLFWLYVYVLTSPEQQPLPRLWRHFGLPAVVGIVTILILASPPQVWDLFVLTEPDFSAPWMIALGVLMAVLQIVLHPQIALYLGLIMWRLMRFRLRLRDVYASTEQHELRWIYVIGGLLVLFWLAQTLMLVFVFDPAGGAVPEGVSVVGSLIGMALVAAMMLWGLRQKPPLAPPNDRSETKRGTPSGPLNKYEKSALSRDAAERLGRKLRTAMERDHLYRDANLSLWSLAKHIGASPNYVSQTLNEVIGESFFDFVNGYRVAEAKSRLATTDDPVLAITYDVGFNARSSFYNAFKRATGETPAKYRKKMSQPVGMDDNAVQTRDS